jgi:hypothetical protein
MLLESVISEPAAKDAKAGDKAESSRQKNIPAS